MNSSNGTFVASLNPRIFVPPFFFSIYFFFFWSSFSNLGQISRYSLRPVKNAAVCIYLSFSYFNSQNAYLTFISALIIAVSLIVIAGFFFFVFVDVFWRFRRRYSRLFTWARAKHDFMPSLIIVCNSTLVLINFLIFFFIASRILEIFFARARVERDNAINLTFLIGVTFRFFLQKCLQKLKKKNSFYRQVLLLLLSSSW